MSSRNARGTTIRTWVVGTAVALALLACAIGCGGSSRAAPLTRYIDQINQIEAGLAGPSQAVTTASRQLAQATTDHAKVETSLRAAAQRIDALRGRLASVTPPEEARTLRRLLLDLLTRESGLARELAAYGAFVPAFAVVLAPLTPAGARLKSQLKAKRSPASTAAALDAYASVVGVAAARVGTLRPPPVSVPARATELATLTSVRTAATALAHALRQSDSSRLPGLVHRFEVAEAENDTLAAQQSRIAAVRKFNARVDALQALAVRIERERGRLQAALA